MFSFMDFWWISKLFADQILHNQNKVVTIILGGWFLIHVLSAP